MVFTLTNEEIAEQIKALESQIRVLKTAANANKPRRKILREDIEKKFAYPGWNGHVYALGDLLPHAQLQMLSKIIRSSIFGSPRNLESMTDADYARYSECLDMVLSSLLAYKK